MSSMYAKFIKEYNDTDIIETDKGFCTYRIDGDECYLDNLYILPKFRRQGIGTEMTKDIENIAKERGCKYIKCAICIFASNPNRSSLFARNNGFLVSDSQHNGIFYIKELR